MKIAVVQLGYNKLYRELCDKYFPINKENFFPDEEVDFHVCTNVDSPSIKWRGQYVHKNNYEGVWPEPTFMKFEGVLESIKDRDYDRVFYLDADNYFDDDFCLKCPVTLLDNAFSIISPTTWSAKYGGYFWGGKTEYVKQFCTHIKNRVNGILGGYEFPLRDNDEEYFSWLEDVKFPVFTYSHYSALNDSETRWIRLVEKDYSEAHSHKRYVDFGHTKGYASINFSMRLIGVLVTHSFSIYGRLEEIGDNLYEITWQDPMLPKSFLNLKK